MRLHKGGQAEPAADVQVIFQRIRVQQRADQQHRIRAHHLGLVNLVFVYREILAEHGHVNRQPHRAEDVIRTENPFRLGQHGNAVRARFLVLSGDADVVELRVDHALGGACLFDLADKRSFPAGKRLFKREIPARLGFGLRSDLFQRDTRLSRRDPLARVGRKFVQNHADTSCVVLINCSSFSYAAPLSISRAAS